MRLIAWGACLTGSLLFACPAAAEKPAPAATLDFEQVLAKSYRAPGPSTAPALDRAEIARLRQGGRLLTDWPRRRPVDFGRRPADEPVHPLFRRHRGGGQALSGLEWREQGSFEGWKRRYEAIGNNLKARVFGKGLADNINVELDGSPEIELRFEFD